MAKPRFAFDPPPDPIPDFNDLSLATSNATDDILLYGLEHGVEPKDAIEFARLKASYEHAAKKKIREALTTGDVSDETLANKQSAFRDFARVKMAHLSAPQFQYLSDAISRKEFDISPYEIPGKHSLNHPFPGATSAMDGIWPGYDKPEYLEHYPFLAKYPEGQQLMGFHREHRSLFHLPETFSRYGGVFVPHPYVSEDLNVELRRHLEQADPLFHTAPKVSPDTTKAELDLLLSFYEDDFIAVVEDAGGTMVGVVGHNEMDGRHGDEKVNGFMTSNWHAAPDGDLTPEEAYVYMETAGYPYMLRLSADHPPRIVTRTTASLSHFLPPFLHKNKLASIAYLRISDVEESKRMLDRLMTDTDGVPGAIVETAHADTQYVREVFRFFREKYQDMFLMTGTVIDPYAVDEFVLEMAAAADRGNMFTKDDPRRGADAVKIGIAEGHACRTANTGVRLTNAYAGLICGASIWKEGTMMLDGWGHPDEFVLGMSAHSVRMRQGGGANLARRESANPWIPTSDGKRGKYYRGMAGADVQEEVLRGQKTLSVSKRMEATTHLHSEGAEEFLLERYPSTVGRMMLMYKFLLQSAMSYQGVRKEVPEKPLMQFQKRAKWFIVPRRGNGH